jgi:hypothetical protein
VLCVLSELPANEGTSASKFIRRKLADWIDSGYLDLYHHPDSSAQMFCLGHGSSNAVAGQILNLPDQGLKCIITRSKQGVGDAHLKIQALKESSRQVAASELEDPGTKAFGFAISHRGYSVDDLRSMMGLESVLQGKKLLSADYCDRYFEKQRRRYADLFVQLLTGPWLTNESRITIHTNQLREEFQDDHDLARKEAILEQIQGCQNFHLSWRNCNVPGPRLDHARELKIKFDDQSCCLVTFEKGLDFVRRRWDTDEYEVTERSKVFVELM